MRTALLFYGQFRFVEECFQSIKQNLIEPNFPDIFFHGWYSDDEITQPYKFGGNGGWQHQRIKKDAHKKAFELYSPVKTKIEPSKKFLDKNMDFSLSIQRYYRGALERPDMNPDFRNKMINNIHSMWYSIHQSNLLKQEYELDRDFKYDCVIRSRFDNVIKTRIEVASLDLSKIHYIEMGQPAPMVSDWLNIGNSQNMDVINSIYPNISKYVELTKRDTGGSFCSELLIRKAADMFGIPVQQQGWHVELPRF
jgi:hypothetical protein